MRIFLAVIAVLLASAAPAMAQEGYIPPPPPEWNAPSAPQNTPDNLVPGSPTAPPTVMPSLPPNPEFEETNYYTWDDIWIALLIGIGLGGIFGTLTAYRVVTIVRQKELIKSVTYYWVGGLGVYILIRILDGVFS